VNGGYLSCNIRHGGTADSRAPACLRPHLQGAHDAVAGTVRQAAGGAVDDQRPRLLHQAHTDADAPHVLRCMDEHEHNTSC
jgi:hypothetical protein